MGPGFLTGVTVGATAMYFLDPQHGGQRRAMARETYRRLRPKIDAGVGAAEPAIRDLGGLVREAAGRVPGLHVLQGAERNEVQGGPRPAIMADLSQTQLEELTRQYDERDRQAWNALTASYGWTPAQMDEVWRWFEQRPQSSQVVNVA